MRKEISTRKGAPPQAIYSQAIVADGPQVYVSGQISVDPVTEEARIGSFREQTELALKNISVLLEAAGTSWAHVVKVHAYLADFDNFPEFNEIYQQFVSRPYPARSTVQVGLFGEFAIEIDCIAVIPAPD
jgi:2-iminobutanoate/2-iminopropanoate deaminase